jgi:hypothetical protein
MKCFLNILLVALVLVIAPLTGADAERKKTKKELAHDDCDNRYVSCSGTCDSLIDINNQVENCRADCASKFDSCNFWADRAAPGQSQPGITNTGGVLDPGPRGPSKKPAVTGQESNAGAIDDSGGATLTPGPFGTRLQKGGTAASP